ncbi:MAG: sister chromatid cohesion protein 1 [Thelocarpon impressellum]|nr:MAG: sister chromatid cohesion protein 1 [Thelocarpon impressellum]
MFYSETLLSKTGPLARVWLSANLERKVSKTHILQSNIENSVSAIVDQGQAPMALRLSGQLLLGVVRIYSRKARYLLDDCNEALMKIKMAFRPGNVDLPANQMNAPNPTSLTLPDVLTELDLLAPMPDASLLLTQPSGAAAGFDVDRLRVGRNEDITLMDMSSQLLQESVEQGRDAFGEPSVLDDIDLDIDIGDDPTDPFGDGTSLEIGRDAPPARPIEDDLLSDLDVHKDALDHEGDLQMEDQRLPATPPPNTGFDPDDDPLERLLVAEDRERELDEFAEQVASRRASVAESVLSSIPSEEAHRLEQQQLPEQQQQQNHLDSTLYEPGQDEEESSVRQPQRARKRKVLQPDADTVLRSTQIKEQQEDRSRVLKPASFLPRDPILLTLEAMQRSRGFASSILGDGRLKGWAPELKGILSLEVIRKNGEYKRKRDSDEPQPEEAAEATVAKRARLSISTGNTAPNHLQGAPTPGPDQSSEIIDLAQDQRAMTDSRRASDASSFDKTKTPRVHPKDSGPVSLGTKHAVHLLRDRLDPAMAHNQNVLFQDLLPERSTSKADATKMFFEVLVLATKDAVKIEQAGEALGGPIKVRGKRGLWGAWAEEEAGGEIASQTTTAPEVSA